jgi:hypothetical protein
MIHGIYVRNKPKGRWQLFCLTSSPEIATNELVKAKELASLEGYDDAEVGVQNFETRNNIPDFLKELKINQKLLFN